MEIKALNEEELRDVIKWQSETLHKIARLVDMPPGGFFYSELVRAVEKKVKK